MVSSAIRQFVLLIPCLILLLKTVGIRYAWYAFWIAEIITCVYSYCSSRKLLKKSLQWVSSFNGGGTLLWIVWCVWVVTPLTLNYPSTLRYIFHTNGIHYNCIFFCKFCIAAVLEHQSLQTDTTNQNALPVHFGMLSVFDKLFHLWQIHCLFR